MDAKIKTIESFNDLLRRAMNAKGVPNMAHLARSIGTARPAAMRWVDRSLPTDPQLEKLARFLDVDLEQFRRARDLSKAIRRSPSLEDELRLVFHRREKFGLKGQPMKEGALCVVLMTDRKIRFDRYDRSIYAGRTAYRVTAILPKE